MMVPLGRPDTVIFRCRSLPGVAAPEHLWRAVAATDRNGGRTVGAASRPTQRSRSRRSSPDVEQLAGGQRGEPCASGVDVVAVGLVRARSPPSPTCASHSADDPPAADRHGELRQQFRAPDLLRFGMVGHESMLSSGPASGCVPVTI